MFFLKKKALSRGQYIMVQGLLCYGVNNSCLFLPHKNGYHADIPAADLI